MSVGVLLGGSDVNAIMHYCFPLVNLTCYMMAVMHLFMSSSDTGLNEYTQSACRTRADNERR